MLATKARAIATLPRLFSFLRSKASRPLEVAAEPIIDVQTSLNIKLAALRINEAVARESASQHIRYSEVVADEEPMPHAERERFGEIVLRSYELALD